MAPVRAEVPNPVPVVDKDIPVEQEDNKSAGNVEEKPKTVILEVNYSHKVRKLSLFCPEKIWRIRVSLEGRRIWKMQEGKRVL